MSRATLSIPGTPPSLNQIGYRSHWAVGRCEKQNWEQFLSIALMEARVPRGLERVSATATIRFKQRRRRDEGNFRALLEKALGDVLQAGGWLPDGLDALRVEVGILNFRHLLRPLVLAAGGLFWFR